MLTRRHILHASVILSLGLIVPDAPYPGTTIEQVVNGFDPLEYGPANWRSSTHNGSNRREWRDANRTFLLTQPELFDLRSEPYGPELIVDHRVQIFCYAYDGVPPGGTENYMREIWTHECQGMAETIRSNLGDGPFVPVRPIDVMGVMVDSRTFEPDHLLRSTVRRARVA